MRKYWYWRKKIIYQYNFLFILSSSSFTLGLIRYRPVHIIDWYGLISGRIGCGNEVLARIGKKWDVTKARFEGMRSPRPLYRPPISTLPSPPEQRWGCFLCVVVVVVFAGGSGSVHHCDTSMNHCQIKALSRCIYCEQMAPPRRLVVSACLPTPLLVLFCFHKLSPRWQ